MRTVYLMLKHDLGGTVLLGLLTLGWGFILTTLVASALAATWVWILAVPLGAYVAYMICSLWVIHAGTQKTRERIEKIR